MTPARAQRALQAGRQDADRAGRRDHPDVPAGRRRARARTAAATRRPSSSCSSTSRSSSASSVTLVCFARTPSTRAARSQGRPGCRSATDHATWARTRLILRLIVQRLGLAVATLVVVSAIVFFFTSVLPGDIAERVLGRESSPEQRQIFRDKLNLDQPVWERYGVWLGDVVSGRLRLLARERPDRHRDDRREPPRTRSSSASSRSSSTSRSTLILATLAALFREKPVDSLISVITLVAGSSDARVRARHAPHLRDSRCTSRSRRRSRSSIRATTSSSACTRPFSPP